jgi:serine/threonine protein kinase
MDGKLQQEKISFKNIVLFKDQILGIGSYGKVCRARCDDLHCAAKLMHETIFDPTAQQLIAPQREHRLPMRRFEQECEFLSTIRHPNIVQYLGICRDPDTGLPALLMELMDDSLTHFLESSPQPIPYHIQVNICHDITLALSFLHSNGIVHRDLSSNNVLLIGNVRAKVTDFGMARLGDINPQATRFTSTMCPGTDVYMPPEAVQDKPVYTEKIDCFSFGVIIVQMLTRQFPNPGDRQVTLNDPRYPQGTLKLCVPEIERRQNHISTIDPNHPLRQVALDCLKDRDVERPSAQQLCERVAALKEDPQYSESVRVVEARSTAEQDRSDERDRELRSLRQQHQDLQQIIQSQTSHLAEKRQTIARKEQTIAQNHQALREKDETIAELREQTQQNHQALREKDEIIAQKDAEQRQQAQQLGEKERELTEKLEEIVRLKRQLGRVNQQLEESERVNHQFQGQITTLRPTVAISSSNKASINLAWREGKKAPCRMSLSESYGAAVDGSTVYIVLGRQIFCYTISTSSWSQLPESPTFNCPSVIINNLLTVVGGCNWSTVTVTNQLLSLTGEGGGRRWTKEFPPMPTKRYGTIALCIEAAVIVAGGENYESRFIRTVEVMNTENLRWSTAADLPQPLKFGPIAVCSDQAYFLGKSNMYTCCLQILLQSCKSFLPSFRNKGARVWKEVAAPPVTATTCVSIHGRLIAVGGKDSDEKPTSAIHIYNQTTDSWEVISHMGMPRWSCIVAVLPKNQLMVVGGFIGVGPTESVEVASVMDR